ncbi:MAG: hypothetical protein OXQ92_08425 [Boseongicola sp.]|nr:hypothetical protein [Boseongicola sp.]MDD9978816.1 hypothetical protein [Boseongicola sp.]
MPHQPKIATCCYCGTRAALVLAGKERHELACANCGAPLHDLKMLRSDARGERELVRSSPIHDFGRPGKKKPKKAKKKNKSLAQRFMQDVVDFEVDDFFDDIFDIFD